MLVDAANQPVITTAYLANVKKAALAARYIIPNRVSLVGNTANGLKYPYNPFYGEFSPPVAVAWNPHFDGNSFGGKIFGHQSTVIRGGYGRHMVAPTAWCRCWCRCWTRPRQPVACNSNLASVGSPGNWACGGSIAGTYSNGFRVGSAVSSTGGPTVPLVSNVEYHLPQPAYPGFNNTFSSNPEGLDPNFRANAIDSFDFTLQRQISHRVNSGIRLYWAQNHP